MRLTQPQQEVIYHLRKGWQMYKNVSGLVIEHPCTMATFSSLKEKKLIKRKGGYQSGKGVEYVLSAKGLTIPLPKYKNK